MRDIIFTLIIMGVLPTCFRRPYIGLVTFSWLAYMRTQDLTWGFAREQRWSYLVAVAMFSGFLLNPRERWFIATTRTYMMIALIISVGIGVLTHLEFDSLQVPKYLEFIKIVVIALFTTAVVKTREHLRILMWVIALSFGFFGVKVGLSGVLSGGSMRVLQGPGGMLEDNNDFSLALGMALPMLVSIYTSEQRKIFRRAMLIVIPLTVLTIIMTYSRGGFLSLTAVICAVTWRSRNRWLVIGLVGAACLVGINFIPAEWFERISSIKDYEEDGSAMGRLRAWATGSRMALANPLFGVGFTNFQQYYARYAANSWEHVRVAHNSYIQIWAECGTISLVLYLSMIFLSFKDIWAIRREARQRYFSSWIISYATMFEASFACFLVGSTFLNRAHFDLFYHFVAITVVFGRIAREEMRSSQAYPVKAGARSPLKIVERGGFERTGVPKRTHGFRDGPAVGGAH